MAPLQALSSVLLLLLVAQHARTARASTLEDTCRIVGTGGEQDYDFCVKTLGADPASATADELGLAVIALRIAMATAKATGDRIAQLQAAETSPRRRVGLYDCAKDYAWTVRRLGRAAKDFATGGGDEDEATALLEVRGTPARCDNMFVVLAGESSPLTDADRELDSVIELAFNILWHAVHNGAK